jgi:hypothetical protein
VTFLPLAAPVYSEFSMRLPTLIACRTCAAALLLTAALASPAGAVVISGGSDAPNLVEPGSNPLWNNVGLVNTASGVYLGNRWVITANHVGSGSLRLSDGREFAASVGSGVRLQNIIGFGSPDLWMFRLAADPGLAAPAIATAAPAIGAQVMMIGAGRDKAPQLKGWQITFPQWTEVPAPRANALGFSLLSNSAMRWGINQAASETTFDSNTFVFSTRFDQFGLPFEAQAAVGDSGGGVFHPLGDAWELSGIMLSTQMLAGQPSDTVAYGDQTFIADLSAYRGGILDLINQQEPLWQNQVNHFDVSGSGRVEPRDVLFLVNELQSAGSHDLTGAPGPSDSLFDVNGDYRVSAADVQQLVNALLGGIANQATAASQGVTLVSEPSTAALAVGGWLLIALARVALRRRRPAARRRQR